MSVRGYRGKSLAGFCRALTAGGADGIFYASVGWAREGYLTLEEWKEFVEPYDRMVLESIPGSMVLLHTCGMHSNPQRFADYPISALHWDQCAEGNPEIYGSRQWLGKVTPMGGINELLFGTDAAERIYRESLEVLQKNRETPFIFVPNCSVSIYDLKNVIVFPPKTGYTVCKDSERSVQKAWGFI